MKTLSAIFAVLLVIQIAAAVTLHVPSEYPDIQSGIDAAIDGDTVLIDDGTYTGTGNKNLDFLGKAITVTSENGPETCIIDCEYTGRGFYFHSGEDSTSILQGVKIYRALSEDSPGGGIYCSNSSPLIIDCHIISCRGYNYGSGISCEYSNAKIIGCVFEYNGWSTTYFTNFFLGGGFSITANSDILVEDCCFFGNFCNDNGGNRQAMGGGIYVSNSTLLLRQSDLIENAVISGYSGLQPYYLVCGGGLFAGDSSSIIIENSTISQNIGYNDWAQAYGAGLCIIDSEIIISDSYISGNGYNLMWLWSCNLPTEVAGGGIFALNSTVDLYNTCIDTNTTESCGGGIRLDNSILNASFSFIGHNYGGSYGGGIYASDSSTLTIDHCNFYGNIYRTNSPNNGEVGGIYAHNSSLYLTNSVFSQNWSPCLRILNLTDGDIRYNDFFESGYCYAPDHPGIGVINNNNANGDPCDVYLNIFLDPLFVDGSAGDFRLSGDSPCIDAGDPNSPPDPDGTIADIGAFFFDQSLPVVDDLVIIIDGDDVMLSWTEIPGASVFHLYRSTEPYFDITGMDPIASITETSYIDTIALIRNKYFYRVTWED